MYYLPEYGSAPILMNELATFLHSRGRKVEVITTIPRPPHHKSYRWKMFQKDTSRGFLVKRFRTNFTVHHIGRLVAWSIYTLFSILNLARVRRGDVLFLRLPPLQLGVAGIVAKKVRRARILLSVQDIHPDLSIESGLLKKKWAISLARRFERWMYRHADQIVVISEGFKQNLRNKDVDPDRMKVIPNWVDTDILKPLPKDNPFSRKHQLHDKFVAMYSGTITLSSYLSLEKIIMAAQLLKDTKDLYFVFVGEGLKKPDLVERAQKLDLENTVFFSFQPYEDLPHLLATSDLLFVPLDREKTQLSVPSKLYNYIAAGRPILGLTDDESEVARIIRDADCGFSIEPDCVEKIADAILSLKSSEEERKKFGKNARRYCVDNYSRDKILNLYENSILSLSGKEGG